MPEKSNVLLVGSGGVGTMGAYNLEVGGSSKRDRRLEIKL